MTASQLGHETRHDLDRVGAGFPRHGFGEIGGDAPGPELGRQDRFGKWAPGRGSDRPGVRLIIDQPCIDKTVYHAPGRPGVRPGRFEPPDELASREGTPVEQTQGALA